MVAVKLLTLSLLSQAIYNEVLVEISEHFDDVLIFSASNSKSLDLVNQVTREIYKDRPRLILTKYSNRNFLELLTTPFLVLVFVSNDFQDTLGAISASLKHFQILKLVFTFVEEPSHKTATLDNLFSWCFNSGALNVLAVIGNHENSLEFHSYNPYPIVEQKQLSKNEVLKDLFAKKACDLKGIPMNIAVVEDYPRSFEFVDRKGQHILSGGFQPKFILTFVAHLNATPVLVTHLENGEPIHIFDADILMSDGKVELSTFLRSMTIRDNLVVTMPFAFVTFPIIVPHSPLVPPSSYFTMPFQLGTWLAVITITIYIGVAEYLHGIYAKCFTDFGRALCNSLLGITSQSIPSDRIISWRCRVIRFQLIFIGFILTNLYLAYLSTFLTTGVYEPQLTTYERIRAKGLKIMVEDICISRFIKYKLVPEYWKEIFTIVDKSVINEHVFSLNTSYGYSFTSDDLNVLSLYQTNLERPLFIKTHIQLAVPYVSTLIRNNSAYLDVFDEYILNAWSSGIFTKWRADGYLESLVKGFGEKAKIPDYSFKKLSLEHIEPSAKFLGMGLACALLCFLFEVLISVIRGRK